MKFMIYLGATIGGIVGGYLPIVLFHVDALSMWSILMGIAGTLVGIYVGYKAGQMLGE